MTYNIRFGSYSLNKNELNLKTECVVVVSMLLFSLEVSTLCCKNQMSPSNVNDHVFFCRCIFRGSRQ